MINMDLYLSKMDSNLGVRSKVIEFKIMIYHKRYRLNIRTLEIIIIIIILRATTGPPCGKEQQ